MPEREGWQPSAEVLAWQMNGRLNAPLRNLPALYQLWCTLQLFDELLAAAVEAGYALVEQRLVRRHRHEGFVRLIPDGKPMLIMRHPDSGCVIRVIPERTYGREGKLRRLSFPQRPDIAIEVKRPGEPMAVYLFDPKYKLDSEQGAEPHEGKPKKVDIDKMHAYRDAIRDAGGSRVVQYAAVMYPGPTCRYGPGVEALHAVPGTAGSEPWLLEQMLQ